MVKLIAPRVRELQVRLAGEAVLARECRGAVADEVGARRHQPFTRKLRSERILRIAARWSPWSSMRVSPTVPPVPSNFFSSFPKPSKKSEFLGSPSKTVTVLPPRPFVSIRSLTTTFGGIFSSTVEEHLQSFAGHPHVAQTEPTAVE